MCIVSNLSDHFDPFIPSITKTTETDWSKFFKPEPSVDLTELKNIIDEFKRLLANAKELDAKLNQPDCEAPEKAKIIDRIKVLLDIIENPPEFVIAEGKTLEPGTYKVINRKLYKVVE